MEFKASGKYSTKAKEFIEQKLRKLHEEKGKGKEFAPGQDKAIALEKAREKGMKVPEPKKSMLSVIFRHIAELDPATAARLGEFMDNLSKITGKSVDELMSNLSQIYPGNVLKQALPPELPVIQAPAGEAQKGKEWQRRIQDAPGAKQILGLPEGGKPEGSVAEHARKVLGSSEMLNAVAELLRRAESGEPAEDVLKEILEFSDLSKDQFFSFVGSVRREAAGTKTSIPYMSEEAPAEGEPGEKMSLEETTPENPEQSSRMTHEKMPAKTPMLKSKVEPSTEDDFLREVNQSILAIVEQLKAEGLDEDEASAIADQIRPELEKVLQAAAMNLIEKFAAEGKGNPFVDGPEKEEKDEEKEEKGEKEDGGEEKDDKDDKPKSDKKAPPFGKKDDDDDGEKEEKPEKKEPKEPKEKKESKAPEKPEEDEGPSKSEERAHKAHDKRMKKELKRLVQMAEKLLKMEKKEDEPHIEELEQAIKILKDFMAGEKDEDGEMDDMDAPLEKMGPDIPPAMEGMAVPIGPKPKVTVMGPMPPKPLPEIPAAMPFSSLKDSIQRKADIVSILQSVPELIQAAGGWQNLLMMGVDGMQSVWDSLTPAAIQMLQSLGVASAAALSGMLMKEQALPSRSEMGSEEAEVRDIGKQPFRGELSGVATFQLHDRVWRKSEKLEGLNNVGDEPGRIIAIGGGKVVVDWGDDIGIPSEESPDGLLLAAKASDEGMFQQEAIPAPDQEMDPIEEGPMGRTEEIEKVLKSTSLHDMLKRMADDDEKTDPFAVTHVASGKKGRLVARMPDGTIRAEFEGKEVTLWGYEVTQ